jgi:hypothetical protein
MAKWICRVAPPLAFVIGAGLMYAHVILNQPAWATPPAAIAALTPPPAAPPAPAAAETSPSDDTDVKSMINMGAFTQFKNSAAIYMALVNGVETIRKDIAEMHLALEEARGQIEDLQTAMKSQPPAPAPKAIKPVAPPKAAPHVLPPFGRKKAADGWAAKVRPARL